MKYKMKKSIIMTTMYCMGIGFLTLSIGALYPVKYNDDAAEAINNKSELVINSNYDDVDNNKDALKSGSALASSSTTEPIPTPLETVTPEPTPTQPPIYELTVGEIPEIESFFQDYYVAWNSCDYSVLKALTTNPENIIPLIDLQKETRFVDDIRETTCYILKSKEDKSYIVYVYYEMKYINIKTTLPRLDKFYLITDANGDLKIFNSKMEDTFKEYFDERDLDSTISDIIDTTNDQAKAALEKDESLRLYVESLYRR